MKSRIQLNIYINRQIKQSEIVNFSRSHARALPLRTALSAREFHASVRLSVMQMAFCCACISADSRAFLNKKNCNNHIVFALFELND